MNVLFFTNEYPPYIYGGAGIHVQYLSRELAKLMPVHVRCFGDQNVTSGNLSALGFSLNSDNYTSPKPLKSVFGALQRCLDFNTLEFKSGPRALPHLVCAVGWYPCEIELRHPDGNHGAFPGTAASMETRAARRRIRF